MGKLHFDAEFTMMPTMRCQSPVLVFCLLSRTRATIGQIHKSRPLASFCFVTPDSTDNRAPLLGPLGCKPPKQTPEKRSRRPQEVPVLGARSWVHVRLVTCHLMPRNPLAPRVQ
ncbi:hypothetical protein M501DRAFT_687118 [Patellaria atrata CBS 101060]|uniref:Uncharacterized protein n=1 Tax=Patellaria atrata CBS 101060 TaxID=1346257 RepID=A0A9P4VSC2_9PEZI|nr:hypothetical protein M501DRAFT_687118 [Patellaria atrata CBS 101060]